MKKKLKIKGPPGFELGTSRSAIESSLIKTKQIPLSYGPSQICTVFSK